jgi:dephospho-CoA kinase
MDFVVDANVLGEVCRNNPKARELLEKIRTHRIVYCTEIFKEYKVLPRREFCRVNSKIIKEWIIHLMTKSGIKVDISRNINKNINPCFFNLIRRNKFKKKDMIYICVAQISNDKLLIAFEQHFINADRCISQLGIKRLNLEDASEMASR